MKVKYIGPFDELEVPGVAEVVPHDGEFDVADDIGAQLLAQPDNFEAVDSDAQAYLASLDEETLAAHAGVPYTPAEELRERTGVELLEAFRAGELEVSDLRVPGLEELARALEISPVPKLRDELIAAITEKKGA